MELFKFIPGAPPTDLQHGQVINNATSIMWTERYFDPGEFEIKAPLSSGLREFLPIGTFISHVDTLEVMFVENHQISEGNNEDPVITITGRSLEAYLENRIVGMNLIRSNSTITDYISDPQFTWIQALWLINDHIIDTADPNDNLINMIAVWDTSMTGPGTYEERIVPRGTVHKAVLDTLAIDDCGIRTIRKNSFSSDPMSSPNETRFVVYRGINRTDTVIFSWKSGDLTQAEYLWSDKNLKNSAAVIGRYVYTYVDTPGLVNYDRRIMIVNADDLDGNLDTAPTGAELTAILEQMHVRGRAALQAQNRITLTRADLSMTSKYQYRKDFFVGDIIRLDGNFGQIAAMRVIEYVEIQDENGETGHPTLSVPIYYEGM